jgi:transposase-like protein
MKRDSTPADSDPGDGGQDDEHEADDSSIDDGAVIACPYCGASNEIALDPSGGHVQRYVEDCQVCCQPWSVQVRYARDGSAEVTVEQQ